MSLFRPHLHGGEPADVTAAEDMPPRPQRGAVNDPEGGWWGMSGIVRAEFDPCGAGPIKSGEDT